MKASGSIVSHEAGVIRRFSRLARASSHGASGGAVGQAVRGRSALPAGAFSLRATRRTGPMPAVPHSSGPTLRITSTPNQALQRTVPRVTAHASHRRSHPSRLSPTHGPRRAPRSLSLRSLGVSTHALSMKASNSIVSHEAGVIRCSLPQACAALGGASGGAVGKTARGRNALQAGRLGLRATRRTGSIRAVPLTAGPTPRISPTPNQALQRTVPRVTAHAAHRRSHPSRLAPTHGPRRAPRSLSLESLGVSSRFL